MQDHYYLLGVSEEASVGEIKSAYRKLARKFHPDTNKADAFFADRFRALQAAYETLTDPNARLAYDRERRYALTVSSGMNRRAAHIATQEAELYRQHEELSRRELAFRREVRLYRRYDKLLRILRRGEGTLGRWRAASGRHRMAAGAALLSVSVVVWLLLFPVSPFSSEEREGFEKAETIAEPLTVSLQRDSRNAVTLANLGAYPLSSIRLRFTVRRRAGEETTDRYFCFEEGERLSPGERRTFAIEPGLKLAKEGIAEARAVSYKTHLGTETP